MILEHVGGRLQRFRGVNSNLSGAVEREMFLRSTGMNEPEGTTCNEICVQIDHTPVHPLELFFSAGVLEFQTKSFP